MNTLSSSRIAKIALIPLLLGVLYWVFPRPATDARPAEPTPSRISVAANLALGESKPTQVSAEFKPKAIWPTIRSQDVTGIDPFDRRMIIPEALMSSEPQGTNIPDLASLVSSKLRSERESLKIQAVFQSPNGISALVGDRVVQVGDRLDDGSKVIEITQEKIVLSPTEIH